MKNEFRLVCGRSHSGKTGNILERAAGLARDEGKDVLILVPEHHTFEYDRLALQLLGAYDAQKITVTSFARFARELLLSCGESPGQSVSDSARLVLMASAVQELGDELEFYRRCTSLDSVKSLINTYDEIKNGGFSIDDVVLSAEKSGDKSLRGKTGELKKIFALYDALLSDGYPENRDDLTLCAEMLYESDGEYYVFADEFSGFTYPEYQILDAIGRSAELLCVSLCLDEMNSVRSPADPFFYTQRTAERLISDAKDRNSRINIEFCGSRVEKQTSLSQFSADLFLRRIKNPVTDGSVRIIESSTVSAEVREIACTLKRLVRERGLRYRDFGVIVPSEDYLKLLEMAFDAYGVPFCRTQQKGLRFEPLFRLARSACRIASAGLSSEEIFSCLKTGLMGFSVDEISLIENYTIVWNVDYGGWTREWVNNPGGYESSFGTKERETLREINEIRQRAVAMFLSVRGDFKNAVRGRDYIKAIYRFLTETTHANERFAEGLRTLAGDGRQDLAISGKRVWDALMELFDDLDSSVGPMEMTMSRFFDSFEILMESAVLGDIPRNLDEVSVGDARRMCSGGKRVVFIAGANDGVFPAVKGRGYILTDREKLLLRGHGGLFADDALADSLERFLVYKSVAMPEDELYISFSRTGADGKDAAPGELILQARKFSSDEYTIKTGNFADEDILRKIESERTAFSAAAACLGHNTPLEAALKKYFSGDEQSRGMLETAAALATDTPYKISDKATAEELFGRDMKISPSRIDKYSKCPYMYFCQYGLDAKKLKPAELSKTLFGTIMHYIFENIFRKSTPEEIAEKTEGERIALINSIVSEYKEKNLTPSDSAEVRDDARFDYRLVQIEREALGILNVLTEQFMNSRFRVRDTELNLLETDDIKPYTMPLENGSVTINGTVDRVDVYEKDGNTYLAVIDYKTGTKDFAIRDIQNGINLQLPIYLMCLWQNGRERYGNVVPAGMLYSTTWLDRTWIGDRYSDVGEECARAMRFKGLVLRDDTVLDALDINGTGEAFQENLIKSGKNGRSFGKNALSMAQMKILRQAVEKQITGMGNSLHDGIVCQIPVSSKNSPCAYCDYREICPHEDDGRVRELNEDEHWLTDEPGGDGDELDR